MSGLCASPRCRVTGRHRPDCGGDCRGCLPNTAGAGLRLCYGCADGIGRDAVAAAQAHTDLALNLAPSASGEGGAGVNPHPSLALHEGVIEARATIRHTLASWTRLIAEERGIHVPWRWQYVLPPHGHEGPANRLRIAVETTTALGEYIQVHARWLAAQDYAGECADEMAELVTAARRASGPSGTRVIEVGPCPMPECGGTLRGIMRTERSLIPSSVSCDADSAHEWTAADWPALAKSMRVAA